MNKYGVYVALVVFGALTAAVPLGLRYSQATIVYGIIAAISAFIVVRKIPDNNWAIGFLAGLANFASFPLKKLFQIDGFINEALVTFTYLAILWSIGLGWKRRWR